MSLVGPSEVGKSQFNYSFSTKLKIYFFYQHSQPVNYVLQREMESLEFVRGVNFELIDSLKNNGTNCLLIFDDFLADVATAGRHRGLSTICTKHNRFHQSKQQRGAELQLTHIVLVQSSVI